MTNPEVLRKTLECGGENLVKGLEHLLDDLERGKGQLQIKMTDPDAFEVGRNIAITPGKVVFQNELIQLLQYEPTTPDVAKRPAADHAALDQQVLHPRSPGEELLHPLGRGRGPDGLRHLLGQSRREARPQDLRGLHGRRAARCFGRRREGDRREEDQHHRLLPGRHPARRHSGLYGGQEDRPRRLGDLPHDAGGFRRAGRARRLHRRGAAQIPRSAHGGEGLSRRQRHGLDLQHAAGQRPDLVLRGQQLPLGQGALPLRPALLEFRFHPHARRHAQLLSAQDVSGESPGEAGRHHAR